METIIANTNAKNCNTGAIAKHQAAKLIIHIQMVCLMLSIGNKSVLV